MLHSPTRVFSPLKTAPRGNLRKKRMCSCQRKKTKLNNFHPRFLLPKSCTPRTKDLVSPELHINTSKRKHRHCCSSHILLSGISRKPLTKVYCIYCASWRPESAKIHYDLLWTRTGCEMWEKPTSMFFSARTFSVFLWAISTLGVMPQIPQIISL